MWKLVKDMIRERVNVAMELSLEEIILGFKPDAYNCSDLTAKAIQRLLLVVKWYIYKCKVRTVRPNYMSLLHQLKFMTEAEFRYVSKENENKIRDRDINMILCCREMA